MIIEEVLQNLSTYSRLLLLNFINVTESLLKTNELLRWKLVLFIVSPVTLVFSLYFQILESGDFKNYFSEHINTYVCVPVFNHLIFCTGRESYENVIYFLKSRK